MGSSTSSRPKAYMPLSKFKYAHASFLPKKKPLQRAPYGDLNLGSPALIPINVGVMQSFFSKIVTDKKCAINSFKHNQLSDWKIHPKHYLFEPLLRGVPYESVGAPNGWVQALH